MKDRIRQVRKDNNLSMEKFGERIRITKSSVSLLESGKNSPSEQTFKLICDEFNINEDWLRTGKGEMKKNRTKNQEIGAFMNDVMDLPDKTFKKRFIESLSKLGEEDWETIENIAQKLLKED